MSASTLFIPWCSQPVFALNGFSSAHATTSHYQISAFRAQPSPLGTASSQHVMSDHHPHESSSGSPGSDENSVENTPLAPKSETIVPSNPSPFNPYNYSQFGKDSKPAPAATNTAPSLLAANFQYESRARSLSPAVRLQERKVAGREARKHQFLARLRSRRDDAQFDRTGEQLLRIDWMKERRDWEQQMARTGNEYQSSSVFPELFEDEQENNHGYEAQQPLDDFAMPIEEEEEEIAEMISRFEQMDEDEDEDVYSDSGDEYDALFTEVLGQEQTSTLSMLDPPRESDMDLS